MLYRLLSASILLNLVACMSPCQQASLDAGSDTQPPLTKHVLFIIPNFRTSPSLADYNPIPAVEKFKVAKEDSFDRGTVALAAIFAIESQTTNPNRAFGQGVGGGAQYLAASYADFAIGNFMTEGVFPTLLHQDPRYFRQGTGSGWSRLTYSMGQIFITHGDSGRTQFNFSEVVGNSAAVAISEAYYRDNRTARDAESALAMQIGVDMLANVIKEFWPDLERKFGRGHGGGKTADSLARE